MQLPFALLSPHFWELTKQSLRCLLTFSLCFTPVTLFFELNCQPCFFVGPHRIPPEASKLKQKPTSWSPCECSWEPLPALPRQAHHVGRSEALWAPAVMLHFHVTKNPCGKQSLCAERPVSPVISFTRDACSKEDTGSGTLVPWFQEALIVPGSVSVARHGAALWTWDSSVKPACFLL